MNHRKFGYATRGIIAGVVLLAATLPLYYSAFHFLRRNTVAGSRKNIVAHYDLGNDFYKLFLDETMTYSCGIFEGPDVTMKEASIAKYDRICRKLTCRIKIMCWRSVRAGAASPCMR